MEKLDTIKGTLADAGRPNPWIAEQVGHDYDAVSKWYTNTLQPDLQTSVKITEMLRMNIRELVVDRNKY